MNAGGVRFAQIVAIAGERIGAQRVLEAESDSGAVQAAIVGRPSFRTKRIDASLCKL